MFSISKVIMLTGALWIIIYSILTATSVSEFYIFSWKISYLWIIGFIYIFIPFSVKPGLWSRVWAILISAFSIMSIVGSFVGNNDFTTAAFYLGLIPYFLLIIGSVIWIIRGK